jgi:hypothetical protein
MPLQSALLPCAGKGAGKRDKAAGLKRTRAFCASYYRTAWDRTGAAKDSGDTVRILERFIRAGIDAATAMRILNAVMLLKGGEDAGCATVDLLCIDLFSGVMRIYKYGAAPTYVKRGSAVRRIKGET